LAGALLSLQGFIHPRPQAELRLSNCSNVNAINRFPLCYATKVISLKGSAAEHLCQIPKAQIPKAQIPKAQIPKAR